MAQSARQYNKTFGPLPNAGGTSFENPSGGAFLSISLDPITSAVPEPAEFAMLLAGLALIGAVVSRRKRAA